MSRSAKQHGEVTAPDAILATDTGRRLDAIVRRHGGKPKPPPAPAKQTFPPIGRRSCDDQLALDEAGER